MRIERDEKGSAEERCVGWLDGRRICIDRNRGVNGSRRLEWYVRKWKRLLSGRLRGVECSAVGVM